LKQVLIGFKVLKDVFWLVRESHHQGLVVFVLLGVS